MLNKLKVMLFGGKPSVERRRVPSAGNAPKVGAYIAKKDLVIKITDTITTEMWEWFVLMGWREISMRTNRRKLVILPQNAYAKLAKAGVAERELIYNQMMKATLNQTN
jgi:hypothetical protein